MPFGTVKWFNRAQHYGFIVPEGGDTDVFVHISAVERAGLPTLQPGQRLQFDLQPDRKGKEFAVDLVVLG